MIALLYWAHGFFVRSNGVRSSVPAHRRQQHARLQPFDDAP